ncbi:heavy-metal-associated domain-containing protein [Flagellimonas hadalis]|uniref:Heavy metal transporter n=1 Tax=Flagellimonas hadalis TaxID=2597517 RepID=A0A5N5J3L5_9FLAO|nr:heavy metal-associated domain-containing protein [Allomuricauda hadalis]KAB5489454.1 heavy metal transporter [Allomuricauda hadalis]
MKHRYTINGMTCGGCASAVQEQLSKVEGVQQVEVSLEKAEAVISMGHHVPLRELRNALSDKYSISAKTEEVAQMDLPVQQSKWKQLKPLFLIFGYLFVAAFLLNYKNWSYSSAMLDFMGLFYVVFSFFKFLDLKGFPESFRMYDPLAKVVPLYGWIYPFLELALGLLFLMRFQIELALIVTVVILGITTFGVTKSLLDKKSIRCACLGTALNLPMTEATFIENAIMLVMALIMLF